jgi:hypothetical protein
MKLTSTILAAAVLSIAVASASFAQDRSTSVLSAIERAFSTSDADSIADMSAGRVEIAVLGKSRLYSRRQARYVLKDFFDQYPPLQVTLSEPSSTEKGIFAAGTYRFATDREPLRLYVRLRRDEPSWVLREIVLERVR